MRAPRSWDVFCRVVDNFGDAAVCWRLARQLADEHSARVRLWIDDLAVLSQLEPAIDTRSESQQVAGVCVERWPASMDDIAPAEAVVEAFGCGIPDEYARAMSRRSEGHVWVVLEYLSAEPWVVAHHGLPSPHPRYQLQRFFFFPGFVAGTGGLLRDAQLCERRASFSTTEWARFWASIGHEAPPAQASTISMFGYASAPFAELLSALEQSRRATVVALPEGQLVPSALSYFGIGEVPRGRVLRRAALQLRILPFLPQAVYDELLCASDINFVRGEDSFVRAQWAGRPFVWNIYPQPSGAHTAKLDAFLHLYSAGLPDACRTAIAALTKAWNRTNTADISIASAWSSFARHIPELHQHAGVWRERLAAAGSLAANLARFCASKLE